jgi:hypothetical protein
MHLIDAFDFMFADGLSTASVFLLDGRRRSSYGVQWQQKHGRSSSGQQKKQGVRQ